MYPTFQNDPYLHLFKMSITCQSWKKQTDGLIPAKMWMTAVLGELQN